MINRFLNWLAYGDDDQKLHIALALMILGFGIFFVACWIFVRSIIYPVKPKPLDGFQRLRDNLDREPPSPPPGRGLWIVILFVLAALVIAWLQHKATDHIFP